MIAIYFRLLLFSSYLNKIVSAEAVTPTLFGSTDSVQQLSYLQSFFPYANFSLLSNISWLRFWLNLCRLF